MTQILKVKTVQAVAWKTLIEALSQMLADAPLEFTPRKEKKIKKFVEKKVNGKLVKEEVIVTEVTGGIRLTALNPSQSILINMKLDADQFDEYVCTKQKIVVGINLQTLYKILKNVSNYDTITFYMDDKNSHKLGIKIENDDKNKRSQTDLKLMDLDYKDIEIPPATFNSVSTLPSSEFHRLCRDLNQFSECVEITSIGKELRFRCKGEMVDHTTTITDSSDGNGVLNMESLTVNDNSDIIQGVFELKNLNVFTKCTGLCNNIELFLKNDFPLIIKYSVADLGQIYLCCSQKKTNTSLQDDNEDDDYY